MSGGSSGSSEIYVEVPADKGHPLYVSSLPPARYQQQPIIAPICSSCQRLEAKWVNNLDCKNWLFNVLERTLAIRRCKCSGNYPGRAVSSNLPGSDSWLLRRKNDPLCRLHSLPPSCRRFDPHSWRTAGDGENNSKLLRLNILQRSKSMRMSDPAVHFRDEKKRHNQVRKQQRKRSCQHRQRASTASPPALVQVHPRSQQTAMEVNRHHQTSVGTSSTYVYTWNREH